MIPLFHEGDSVRFRNSIHARGIPSPGGNVIIVNQNAHGIVNGYSREGTLEKSEDDFVGIELVSGDEAVGKTVWVASEDFESLEKKHY